MKSFFIFIFLLLVIFYDALSIRLSISFLDELTVLLVFIYGLYIKIKYKIKFSLLDKKLIIIFSFISFIGILSSFRMIQPINIIAQDFIIFIKFFIIYFSMRIILIKKHYSYNLKKDSFYILLFIGVFLFIIVLFDKIFYLFPIFDHKYFNIGSEELFFGHPSRFAFAIEMILVLMLPFFKKNNSVLFVFLFLLILGALSLRTKYFVFVILLLLIFIFLKFLKMKKITLGKNFFISVIFISLMIIFAKNDILAHILIRNDGTQGVRGLLLFSGFDIAIKNFPLGLGFASFGSFASTVSYSPVYYDYHFDVIPGCMPDKPSFLADNFYAMLLGQFGFLGLIAFLYMLYLYFSFFITAYNQDFRNRYYYISGILMIILLLYESISDSLFSQNRGVFIAIYLAFIVTKFEIEVFKKYEK